MENPRTRAAIIAAIALATLAAGAFFLLVPPSGPPAPRAGGAGTKPLKLYWFIPDGLRAEPVTMKVFEWAREGKLPHLRTLMERGTHGYSIPVFPSHTPTNYATLLTGSTPRVHGIADGAMRSEGYPLKMVAKGGFSSVSRRVPPIWHTLEEQDALVALLSVPGSTPPELNQGITIRGRWGGWGLDFPAVNFHAAEDTRLREELGADHRVFSFGSELTQFLPSREPRGWAMPLPASYSPPVEIEIRSWGETVFGWIHDSKDDGKEEYDAVVFSKDKKSALATLREGDWSDWKKVRLSWETQNDYNVNTPKKMSWERELSSIAVDTDVRIKVIKLGKKGFFRIRFFYNNLNEFLVKPSELAPEILEATGPMVDFVDNYPPQLIYFPEDKRTFLEEMRMSLEWHRKAARYLATSTGSDVVIHSIYTPNQMLTSRWWLPYLDPKSPRFGKVSESEREQLWKEVLEMYQGIDAILGEALAAAGPDTIIAFSSDHGAIPLHKEVRLNNLLAREGLLRFRVDPRTRVPEIDWARTQAVYLQMNNIYLNPAGLGGAYRRGSGPAYDRLRERVRKLLSELRDPDGGGAPLSQALGYEEAKFLDLPEDRVGDLVIANAPGFGWVETLSEDRAIFKESLKGGYKQAVLARDAQGLWTPFAIAGPGVKSGVTIAEPIRHIDQYPTIMKLLGKAAPAFVEGKPLDLYLDSSLPNSSR